MLYLRFRRAPPWGASSKPKNPAEHLRYIAAWLIGLCMGLQREGVDYAFGRMVETFGPIAHAAKRFKHPRVDWAEHKAELGAAASAINSVSTLAAENDRAARPFESNERFRNSTGTTCKFAGMARTGAEQGHPQPANPSERTGSRRVWPGRRSTTRECFHDAPRTLHAQVLLDSGLTELQLWLKKTTMGHGERIKMEILHIVGSAASILGLLVALFVAQKVLKIDNSISVKGDRNLTAGRDLLHK